MKALVYGPGHVHYFEHLIKELLLVLLLVEVVCDLSKVDAFATERSNISILIGLKSAFLFIGIISTNCNLMRLEMQESYKNRFSAIFFTPQPHQ